jgi:hypothetical protein
MAAIVNVSDKRFQLGREDWVRTMSIGTNWTKIRVGVTWAINGVAAFPNGFFLIGLCQGGIPYSSPNCIDFVGRTANTMSVANNSYTSTPVGSQSYNVGNSPSYFFFKKGTGLTATTTGASDNESVWAGASGKKTAVFMDFIKNGDTTIGNSLWYHNVTTPNTDWNTLQRFLQDAESENAIPNLAGGGIFTGGVTGSNQLWDSVNLYWNKSSPTIEIGAVVVIKFR